MPNFLCAVLLTAALGSSVLGAEPLRWRLSEGQELRYTLEHHNTLAVAADRAGNFSSETRQTTALQWRVREATEEFATIEQTVESLDLKITMPGGMELAYESKSGKPAEGIAAMLSPMFDVLTQHPLQLKVSPRGEVEDVQADEEALEKLKTLPAIKPLGELAATEGLRQMAEAVAFPLPEGELEEGVTVERTMEVENRILGKLTGTTTWKYTGTVTRDGVEYERFEPTVKLDVSPVAPAEEEKPAAGPKPLADPQLADTRASGEALFDRKAGLLHSLNLKIEFTLSGKIAGHPASCDFLQEVNVTSR